MLERAASEGLGEGYYHWVLERELGPLFMRALSDGNITAWVFGDDTEAIVGLDFLKRNRAAVPGRVSVVGFNNSRAALAADLTSYNNDFEAVMNAMLNYLLRPDSGSDVYAGKEVVLDGYVVERWTCAAAVGTSFRRFSAIRARYSPKLSPLAHVFHPNNSH